MFEGGSQGLPIPFTQFLQQPSFTTLNISTTVVCPDGGTVLLTSHYLEEVQALAQRVVVIDQGVMKADDTLEAILRRVSLRRVAVRAQADLAARPGVVRAETLGDGRQELGARGVMAGQRGPGCLAT